MAQQPFPFAHDNSGRMAPEVAPFRRSFTAEEFRALMDALPPGWEGRDGEDDETGIVKLSEWVWRTRIGAKLLDHVLRGDLVVLGFARDKEPIFHVP